ncbi:tatD [Mytilus edulis]|uniref:TatD n=1 Tax=Mytilus edulis TaxID=6550 RepID=A0A8S3VNE6_MYTED|nr:tatD [Mytilus edulis]
MPQPGWRQWRMNGRMARQRFIEMRLLTPPETQWTSGDVMVHCDPGMWPSAWALQEPPRGSPWVTAIGVHPKKAHQLDDSSFGKMEQLVGLPGVRAIGEVGLDQSQRDPSLQRQVGTLRWVLNLCKGRPEVPLILHIRGAGGPSAEIHLHCFDGGMQEAIRWRDAFPNAYFGFTGEVNKFDQEQGQVVSSLPWKGSYWSMLPLFQVVMGAQQQLWASPVYCRGGNGAAGF